MFNRADKIACNRVEFAVSDFGPAEASQRFSTRPAESFGAEAIASAVLKVVADSAVPVDFSFSVQHSAISLQFAIRAIRVIRGLDVFPKFSLSGYQPTIGVKRVFPPSRAKIDMAEGRCISVFPAPGTGARPFAVADKSLAGEASVEARLDDPPGQAFLHPPDGFSRLGFSPLFRQHDAVAFLFANAGSAGTVISDPTCTTISDIGTPSASAIFLTVVSATATPLKNLLEVAGEIFAALATRDLGHPRSIATRRNFPMSYL